MQSPVTRLARWWAALLVLALLSGALFAAQPAAAEPNDPIPSPILDPDSVGWQSWRNLTSSAFGDYFDKASSDGYMMMDIEVDEIDGQQRVGGVWQRNTDGRGWYETRNMNAETYMDLARQRLDQGYRIIDQEAYELNGSTYYAAIWIENKENFKWTHYYDVTSSEFGDLFDFYSKSGYLMVDVDAYYLDNTLLYSAVWVINSENLAWAEYRNMTSQEFGDKFDELSKAGYRMTDVESYPIRGTQYYAGIWVENRNGRGWAEWRDMTSKGFGEKWSELRDAGYRLIEFEAYPTSNGWRYAGVWRQNSERPNWRLKSQVDALLQDELDDFDIPGMSVAIAENGVFRYLRGFGYADIDDAIAADSRTIYRLASVSKAVGGVLAMELSEQGELDIGADSRDYTPSMPAHHTHTVEQTISNRSGIGHYEDYPSIAGAYSTAVDAADEIWDQDLIYAPGTDYKYSTHAYTFLGASMEGAVGAPISTIVAQDLTTPFGLNTLLAENRSIPNAKRATLYNTSNQEVTPDDLSWKVLGGGLESSAYDLARFGIRLLDGSILTQGSRDTMWTPPDNQSDYALGWNTGTESGSPVVAKNGAQNGARSYIRMYPDQEIVIVVLTNRKNGGHDPVQLGRDIGALMLANAASLSAQAETQELIDEPGEEGLMPEDVIYPVVDPEAEPAPEDLQELPVEPPINAPNELYLPYMLR